MLNNWKSTALLGGIIGLSVGVVMLAVVETFQLPLLGTSGLIALIVLLILTVAVSRVTVSVTGADGKGCYRKSMAEAFVFLAVVLFAVPPANAVGPAVLLAALVGFASTYGVSTRREILCTTGMAVISTFISASLYGLLVSLFTGPKEISADSGLPLNALLVPLFVLAVLQYSLNTLVTTWFLSFDAGKFQHFRKRRR